jgi:hypothetical protein
VQKFSEMNIVIQKLSDEQKFGFSKTNKTLFKIAILGVLVLLFGFVLLIKIFKFI